MVVKYKGRENENFIVENNRVDLIPGKTYPVVNVSKNLGWYRIVDESGEDYLYPPEFFEIVED